jgi:hypothetical protein
MIILIILKKCNKFEFEQGQEHREAGRRRGNKRKASDRK